MCFKSTARRTVTAFPRGAWERAERVGCLKIFGVVGADLSHRHTNKNLTPHQQQRFRFKRLTDANALGNLRINVDGVK
ncbi:hypothetical protein BCS42_06275 [Crenothrix sp. D3]|nr:hypothetical protein BCS42_06275 [Crenothrix sp. D3]